MLTKKEAFSRLPFPLPAGGDKLKTNIAVMKSLRAAGEIEFGEISGYGGNYTIPPRGWIFSDGESWADLAGERTS